MKKILVIQQKMIGDVLVCSILCNNLKKALPEVEIHYMVYESTIPVLEGNPNIDKLVLFTEKHRNSRRAFLKFLVQIRKEKYDVLIDSYSKLESWLTTLLSGAKRRISYRKPGRNFLYTDIVNTYDRPISNLGLIIERRLSLLEPLNLDVAIDPVPKLYVTEDEKVRAKLAFESHRVERTKKSIMISLLGSSSIKTYPLPYMSKLIDYVVEEANANILFNYVPNQLKEAKEIYEECKPATQKAIFFDLLGKDLREYIALMNECDMIIGNDGGAINMAKALNKPSFIIFSPWISQEMWATFEDGIFQKSVHFQQYEPELFEGKSEKELKKNSIALYQQFKPDYLFAELKSFLQSNLNNGTPPNLNALISTKEMTGRQPFSAIVITKNEVKNLPSLIRNLQFADELIIIDSFSDDGTKELLEGHPEIRFLQKEFNNFSSQRNFAISQAKYDWIFFVDADERVPKSLQYEICKVLSSNGKNVAYEFYRQFYFIDKPLKYGGFQTDKVTRLFNKNYAQYNEMKFVHETLDVAGTSATLNGKLLHFSYTNMEKYKLKLMAYARLRAQELAHKNVKPNFFHLYLKPLYRFIYHYFIRRGFLDGNAGLTMAKLNAFGVKKRYEELIKLRLSQQ